VVAIGTDQNGRPVELTMRAEGTYIVGLNGTGKSTLILSMICQDIAAGEGVCVIDPHGDLVRETIERIPPKRHKDVILFDATCTDFPPGFDVFAFQGDLSPKNRARHVRRTTAAFMKTMPAANANRLKNFLRLISLTFLDNPGNTVTEMERVIFDADFRRALATNVRNPIVRRHWESMDRMTPRQLDEHAESTMTRIRDWTYDELILPIIGQAGAGINFRHAMDTRKIVLINLAKGDIDEENMSTLGTFLMDRILAATYSRVDIPFEQRVPCMVYVDEFQNFATPDFGKFFTEARKYKVGLTVAHQMRRLLAEDLQNGSLAAQNKIVFTVDPKDARELGYGLQSPTGMGGLPPWREDEYAYPEPPLPKPIKARLLPAVVPVPERKIAPANPSLVIHNDGHPDPDIALGYQRVGQALNVLMRRRYAEASACRSYFTSAGFRQDSRFITPPLEEDEHAAIRAHWLKLYGLANEFLRQLGAAETTKAWNTTFREIRALAHTYLIAPEDIGYLRSEAGKRYLDESGHTTVADTLAERYLKELETLGRRYAKYYEWEEPPPTPEPEPEPEEEPWDPDPEYREVDLGHVLAQQPNSHVYAKVLGNPGFWQGWVTTPTWEEKPPVVNSSKTIAALMDFWHRRMGLPRETVMAQIEARQGQGSPLAETGRFAAGPHGEPPTTLSDALPTIVRRKQR